jgi:PAS domain S-box-containing protein
VSQVSCRATVALLETLESGGVASAELLRGTPFSEAVLRDPRRRIAWLDWVMLVERSEALLGGPGPFEQAVGDTFLAVSENRILRAIGRVAWTEAQLMQLGVRRILPHLYGEAMEFSLELLSGGRCRFACRIRPSMGESLAVLRLLTGTTRGVPRLIGRDGWARVDVDTGPRHLVLTLQPLPRAGLVRGAARRVAGTLVGDRVVAEVMRLRQQLRHGFKALQASEERLRVITENAFDLIAEIDPAGALHYASPNFREILGLDPRELLGADAFASIHPDEHDDLRERLAGTVAGSSSGHATLRFRHADGAWRWLDTTVKAFRNQLGEVRIVVVARDISETRRSAEELEERNRSLATLCAVTSALQQSLDFKGTAQRIVDTVAKHTEFPAVVLYTLSEDGRSLELSARSRLGGPTTSLPATTPLETGLAGRAVRERRVIWFGDTGESCELHPRVSEGLRALGLQTSVIVPLLSHERAVGALGLAARAPRPHSREQEETLIALGTTAAAALEGARHTALIEREIEEREQAEHALREGEERLREVTENVEGIFYLVEVETNRVLYLGPSFERITGLEREAVLARPSLYYDAVHPDDRERVRAAFENNARGYEIEYRLLRSDGSQAVLLDRAYPVPAAAGPSRVAGFAQDVTALRELELQLRHSQKMEAVGRLAGGIAHDFNNLLTVISGYGEFLRDRFASDDPERATAEEILRAADRASNLTRQLLTLSRKLPLELGPLDLNDVVRQLSLMLRTVVGEGVELRIELAPRSLPIVGDRGQLEQVLVNLALNDRARPGQRLRHRGAGRGTRRGRERSRPGRVLRHRPAPGRRRASRGRGACRGAEAGGERDAAAGRGPGRCAPGRRARPAGAGLPRARGRGRPGCPAPGGFRLDRPPGHGRGDAGDARHRARGPARGDPSPTAGPARLGQPRDRRADAARDALQPRLPGQALLSGRARRRRARRSRRARRRPRLVSRVGNSPAFGPRFGPLAALGLRRLRRRSSSRLRRLRSNAVALLCLTRAPCHRPESGPSVLRRISDSGHQEPDPRWAGKHESPDAPLARRGPRRRSRATSRRCRQTRKPGESAVSGRRGR